MVFKNNNYSIIPENIPKFSTAQSALLASQETVGGVYDFSSAGKFAQKDGFLQPTDNMLEPIWDYIYLCVSLLWLTVGIPGNLLVILSVASFKELK